ncbi:MAG: hypothetical protein NVS4B1_13280 [Ktedonobacteraceae bacterium]
MQLMRILPRFLAVFLVLSVLLVVSSNTSSGIALAAQKSRAFHTSDAFGARPLWQYARKIDSIRKIDAGTIPPCLGSAVLPRCYSPAQIRNAYHVQPLLNAGITGKGHTIVLIDGYASPTLISDLHFYDQLYGLKDPKINIIQPFGPASFDFSATIETMLDVETAHSIAPDATIDLVIGDTSKARTGQDFLTILLRVTQYAVQHNLGDVISQSYGVGETCVSPAYVQAELQIFKEAQAKHITVLASSGDNGAATVLCDKNLHGLKVGQGIDLPASDPFVTAVGGTTLNATLQTGKYVSETAWNEDKVGAGATGGGVSSLFGVPTYQQGVTGLKRRAIPDVAYNGDPLTGVPVVVSIQGTTYITPVGGTSAGSPQWAALVVLANQYAGHRLGFLNDAFYRISQTSSAYAKSFHDITVGNNSVLTYDNNGKPVVLPGYAARTGWDAVTGVGTPNATGLVHLLVEFTE